MNILNYWKENENYWFKKMLKTILRILEDTLRFSLAINKKRINRSFNERGMDSFQATGDKNCKLRVINVENIENLLIYRPFKVLWSLLQTK